MRALLVGRQTGGVLFRFLSLGIVIHRDPLVRVAEDAPNHLHPSHFGSARSLGFGDFRCSFLFLGLLFRLAVLVFFLAYFLISLGFLALFPLSFFSFFNFFFFRFRFGISLTTLCRIVV